jgi:hypothetical protein
MGMVSSMAKRPRKPIPEVPRAIFEKFLGELSKDSALSDITARLRPVLLESDVLSEAAIESALLSDDADGETS